MPGKQSVIAIDVDRERFGVAEAVVSDRSVTVSSWRSFERPSAVSFDDALAVGRWLRVELDRAGVKASKAILAMPRGDVVLKRLSLPGAGTTNDAEVGGMVRLQMARQLTMSSTGAAIDYTAPVADGAAAAADGAVAESGAPGVSVMAGAMPADRVEWCRGLCEGAGLKLKRIALKCYGVAGLLADLSQRRAGALLGVCAGATSVEFVVVEEGNLTFARAIDAPRALGEPESAGYAERVAVEAKRTWMSHRSTRGGGDAEMVVALGSDDSARQLAQQCGAQLERPSQLAQLPATVELQTTVPAEDVPAMHALAGLLLEELGGRRTLDFANPRRAPDLGAARRRNLLAGALGLILLAGGSYIAADRALTGYDERLDQSRTRETELRAKLEDLHAQHARLNHFEQWQKARVDWLAYVGVLNEQLPEAGQVILDGMDGKLADADVVFTPKGSRYQDGLWSMRQSAVFSMDGKSVGRSVSADLRGRLLGLSFDAVESKGPDVPDRFQFVLTTSQSTPAKAKPETAGGSQAPSKPDAADAGKKDAGVKAPGGPS